MFTLAVIGRPNVGKSTLYNRLTGTNHALVHDLPGVTRDRREGDGYIADLSFRVIDTAGLEYAKDDTLESRMMSQTELAAIEADACLFMIDGRAGLIPEDREFATWLRKKNKPVIVVVNKCEGHKGDAGFAEAAALGFHETVAISAEHGEGMGELYQAIEPFKEAYENEFGHLVADEVTDQKPLQICILGRPNTGKSTLLNAILGQERALTGPEAGITRDAIAIDYSYEGRNLRLIDTAGIRRKALVKQKLERLSVTDSLRSLRYAHVAILMIDATMPFEKQDLAIAELIIREGRSVILGINKWDMVESKKKWLDDLKLTIDEQFPQIKGVATIYLSALKEQGVDKLLKTCFEAYDVWNMRIPTARLNEWLVDAENWHLPPLGKNNKRVRLKYVTQGNTRPPTFTLFVNRPKDLPESYRRYLVNSLRERFSMPGTPIRMMLRAGENPYAKKKK